MLRQMVASTIAGLVLTLAIPNAATAQSVDPEFRADIERLLVATGATKIGPQMASLAADSIMTELKRSSPDIPDRAFTIVKEVFDAEFVNMYTAPDGVLPEFVDVYSKHFTHEDVRGLLEFYRSALGQKTLTVLPLLVQEGAVIGQRWMEKRMPNIINTLQQRLRAEGLIN